VFDSETIVHAKKRPIISEKFQKKVNAPSAVIGNTETNYRDTIKVIDIQICLNIHNRVPVGSNTYFKNDIDSIFCYTRLENAGKKKEVAHIWYYKNKQLDRIKYNVKSSNIYRSWTRKTILKTQVGAWRVDIEDSANNVVGSKSFFIMDSEISPR